MYNQQLKDIELMQKKGEIFVIRPSRYIKISHMEKNLNVIQEVYELGRYDAKLRLNELKIFLGQN